MNKNNTNNIIFFFPSKKTYHLLHNSLPKKTEKPGDTNSRPPSTRNILKPFITTVMQVPFSTLLQPDIANPYANPPPPHPSSSSSSSSSTTTSPNLASTPLLFHQTQQIQPLNLVSRHSTPFSTMINQFSASISSSALMGFVRE